MPLTRRLILQKARHHTQKGALTDCKHMVSGTISLPSRGTFHHSLTVLSTIGHTEYLGLPGGPGRFTADSTSPLLLGDMHHTTTHAFTYGTHHPLRRTIPDASTDTRTSCLQVAACTRTHPTTPHTQPLPGITRTRFSLIRYRSPLHTESQLFSSPTGTEMFHFPASTPTQTMYSPAGNTTQPVLGFPIRTSSDQRFVGNSPRHNAASHVLHRLSMPRHPPYARNKTHGHTNNHGK